MTTTKSPVQAEESTIETQAKTTESTTAAPAKKEGTITPITDTLKDVENHKTIASHLENAAKHHSDAAKHHEEGNHEKAAQSTIKAHGHISLANDAQKEDVKQHALKS